MLEFVQGCQKISRLIMHSSFANFFQGLFTPCQISYKAYALATST